MIAFQSKEKKKKENCPADVSFEVMDKDRVTQIVSVKNGKAKVQCVDSRFVYHIVPEDAETEEDVRKALRRRMIKPDDADISEALEFFHLEKYDEFEIAKINHCTSYDDHRWIRFQNEKICYAESGRLEA